MRRLRPLAATGVVTALALPALALAQTGRIGPDSRIVNLGRQLNPYGKQVEVGNVPTGGALTPDGRFYWTVSAGAGTNDVRIVSVKTGKVVQVLPLPGSSGGVAIGPNLRAYVSGLQNSKNLGVTRPDLPGGAGDVVHVFSYNKATGHAKETRQLSVAPPSTVLPPQDFPLPRTKVLGYPEFLAVSGDGRTLVVPLNLANGAQVVDTTTGKARFVATGRYPYGALVLPDNRHALVTNESPGTVSVIDLKTARKVKDIAAGGHLSHPEAIAYSPVNGHAYVTVTNQDRVAEIDTNRMRFVRFLSVRLPAGIGAWPDAVAVNGASDRLYVASAGADVITVFALNGKKPKLIGRVPTGRYPTDVELTFGRSPKLIWLSAKGLGTGPNPLGPSPLSSAALNQTDRQSQFLPRITNGSVGIGAEPSDEKLKSLTRVADAQVKPVNLPASAPADTPLKANGPIKYVFYIVKENRTYDQILGDDPRGDGDPKLTLFGQANTPNVHALVQRFPLLDHVYADGEASQQGHQWTSAGIVTDQAEKSWNQISNPFATYGDRGRPLEEGILAISFPPNGYLFDQATRQGISYFNYGEISAGSVPLPYAPVPILANTKDVDRSAADQAAASAKLARSDFGPLVNGCYPNSAYAGTADVLTGKDVFDSSLPAGAPAGAESRFDCFKAHLNDQLAANDVPHFNYMVLEQNHTQGLRGGAYTPQAMIADNDLAVGQVVDLISHSSIWSQSAIFIVEDDSQDGADHVDAHRIPANVISPYTKPGAVVSTRYDQVSVIRSMELILGMSPLYLTDALATPMYDAFQSTPANIAPYDAVPETQNLLDRNPTTGRGAVISARMDFEHIDAVPQHQLDGLLWHAVHGWHSKPPPPGPNATPGHDADG